MVDNICAPATPYGSSAISIIRCSGPDTFKLINKIFKGKDLTKVNSHTMHYGYIMDGDQMIDEVLCNVFISPKSFDGENCVEINCHGGVLVTNKVLGLLLRSGFRMAERGEFSKRAFLNKKLDLTQAEAIMDVIGAQNDIALKVGTNSLRKSTTKLIRTFRDDLLDILAKIEVNIDYPEYEDSIEVTNNYLLPVIDKMLIDMKVILKNSEVSKIAIHGIKTAIVGKPNVGKSSLLNMLLDEDKAIVSDIPGTTRDLVEGSLNVGNITLHLVDTAGIRESFDYVEKIGIERSTKAIKEANLIFLVLDSTKPLDETDQELIKLTESKPRIIIANKSDGEPVWDMEEAVMMSAKEKTGIQELTDKLHEVTNIDTLNIDEGKFLANQRQIDLMKKSYQHLLNAKEACEMGIDVDLIEIDLKQAFDYLGNITGDSSPEELITALFTKFCLGK